MYVSRVMNSVHLWTVDRVIFNYIYFDYSLYGGVDCYVNNRNQAAFCLSGFSGMNIYSLPLNRNNLYYLSTRNIKSEQILTGFCIFKWQGWKISHWLQRLKGHAGSLNNLSPPTGQPYHVVRSSHVSSSMKHLGYLISNVYFNTICQVEISLSWMYLTL